MMPVILHWRYGNTKGEKMERLELQLLELNDDNLAKRVIDNNDVQNCLLELSNLKDDIYNELTISLPYPIGTPVWRVQRCEFKSCKMCGCNNKYGDCEMEQRKRIRKGTFSVSDIYKYELTVFMSLVEAKESLNK